MFILAPVKRSPLACDVIAVNGETSPEELQLLEILRGSLEIGRLIATAIEHCAQVRFSRV